MMTCACGPSPTASWSSCLPGDGGAAGDAAKAETLVLKAFFDALGTRLAAVATAQDAIV
jgi:hypothetical protein